MEKTHNKVNVDILIASLYFKPSRMSDRSKWRDSQQNHYSMWKFILKKLKSIGWCVYVAKEYLNGESSACIRSGRRSGAKTFSGLKLEFDTHIYKTGLEFQFYQNHNIKNTNGGKYDFDKYEMAPYLLKKAIELSLTKIKDIIEAYCPGALIDIKSAKKPSSEEYLINHHRSRSLNNKKKIKSLSETPLFMSEYDFGGNSIDMDEKQIKCGEEKYYYHYNGRLHKGIAYHNINNMWWVVSNDTFFSNMCSRELFDITPERLAIRRKKSHNPPKEYLEKMKSLNACSIKELKNALKRKKA